MPQIQYMKGKRIVFFLLVCLIGSARFLTAEDTGSEKILMITLPKAGTHLLRKALFLITGHRARWIGLQTKHFNPSLDLLGSHRITGMHLFPLFDPIRTQYLHCYKTILLIRDPRDIMLSFASHLRRGLTWTSCPTFDHEQFLTLSLEGQLEQTFLFPTKYLNPAICFPYVELWMKEPSVFVCRFEDLVGSRGGGSDERQFQVLMALAKHIGYPLAPEEMKRVIDKLFGGTWTFDVGKIGRWKEEYSKDNIELFMELYGDFLPQWGYF